MFSIWFNKLTTAIIKNWLYVIEYDPLFADDAIKIEIKKMLEQKSSEGYFSEETNVLTSNKRFALAFWHFQWTK